LRFLGSLYVFSFHFGILHINNPFVYPFLSHSTQFDPRVAIESLPNRPALLRKDFIVDEYQIYEARVYGADTLLLIVAALTQEELEKFLNLSRLLDMEPLVEVNTADEMSRALQVGSKIIGINNRNLHDFTVDLDTTRRLTQGIDVPSDVTFVALSGISSRKDVEGFEQIGTRAVLVGESLMRAADPAEKIRELQGKTAPIVKICGIKDVATALAIAEAGADMIGVSFSASLAYFDVVLIFFFLYRFGLCILEAEGVHGAGKGNYFGCPIKVSSWFYRSQIFPTWRRSTQSLWSITGPCCLSEERRCINATTFRWSFCRSVTRGSGSNRTRCRFGLYST
jgi:hypothetical protein